MKIVFKGPEENLEEEECIPCSHLKDGTFFKFGDGVFFISSTSYENKKLMTRLDTGVTYTVGFNCIRKKDIIKDSKIKVEDKRIFLPLTVNPVPGTVIVSRKNYLLITDDPDICVDLETGALIKPTDEVFYHQILNNVKLVVE